MSSVCLHYINNDGVYLDSDCQIYFSVYIVEMDQCPCYVAALIKDKYA